VQASFLGRLHAQAETDGLFTPYNRPQMTPGMSFLGLVVQQLFFTLLHAQANGRPGMSLLGFVVQQLNFTLLHAQANGRPGPDARHTTTSARSAAAEGAFKQP